MIRLTDNEEDLHQQLHERERMISNIAHNSLRASNSRVDHIISRNCFLMIGEMVLKNKQELLPINRS
jgi:hypothetical protein